jgi:hypothetical protein
MRSLSKLHKDEQTDVIPRPNAWGYNWTTLFLGEINTIKTWTTRLGSLKMERVK